MVRGRYSPACPFASATHPPRSPPCVAEIIRPRLVRPPARSYSHDRFGYDLPWFDLPLETRHFFFPMDLAQLIKRYLGNARVVLTEVHVNAATELGLGPQPVHVDLSQRGVITYMLMLTPGSVVGTLYFPGSHASTIAVGSADYHLVERATYTHNGLLFDSLLRHCGPAATRPVFKLSIIFVRHDTVFNSSRWSQLLEAMFNENSTLTTPESTIPLADYMK